jgi:hypothetical protein
MMLSAVGIGLATEVFAFVELDAIVPEFGLGGNVGDVPPFA